MWLLPTRPYASCHGFTTLVPPPCYTSPWGLKNPKFTHPNLAGAKLAFLGHLKVMIPMNG